MKKQWAFVKITACFCLFLLIDSFCSLQGQETEGFKPSGSPLIVLFGDYTTGLGKNNHEAGFNLTRSRMGYQYQVTPSLSAVSVLDVNAAGDTRTVNFHYAFLEWNYQDLTVDAGLVALSQFAVQEAFWGRRYIEKSFQDLNGFCFDSDAGVSLKYRFTDWLDADVTVINGEGTMHLNTNKTNRYGLGATLRPLAGLTLRAYLDIYGKPSLEPEPSVPLTIKNQSTIALFAGYRNEWFSLGAEYNRQTAKNFIGGNNYSGVSAYAGLPLGKRFDLFARYDYVDTETTGEYTFDWGSSVNKNTLIAGLEFHPVKHLQLSPNYRYIKPLAGDASHFICLNVGFSL
ncbi:hypothetical protein EZS27_001684 [termite gut metagenome]|uniref:Porin n=1 Tax=termite gut metagenome TaxID=433724 RepID=A0A5J4SY97_9ZZZZ